MKILLIGGTRFVGPYVIDLLLESNHDLTVFNRGNFALSRQDDVKFVKGDRGEGFSGINDRFDVVIDMCAYRGEQTVRVLKELKFDFLVHFSTVAAYQKAEIFPIAENSPLGEWEVCGEYGRGKRECEEVLQKSRIPYAALRPTYILGPKNYVDRENFIYSRLSNKQPVILPGNGLAVNQFVFAEEVARSLVLLAENQVVGAYNCCGDDLITLKGLVESMANLIGVDPVIKNNPRTDGVDHNESEFPFANDNSIFSNEKIKKLGIRFTPLLEGLRRDYQSFYRNNMTS
ncbi:MAG: NAD-dependent epimerase/dehydratase family protein [Patescibacteria group bacterium]